MHIYQSPSYKQLVATLAQNIKNSSNTPFQPEYLIGANNVTKNYVKEQLATQNGIAANLCFLSWNELIHLVFRALKPNYFELDYVSTIASTQYLFDALSDATFCTTHAQICSYYTANTSKQYGLAQKLDRLFRDYLKYNPSLLQNWSNGIADKQDINTLFQCELWMNYRIALTNNNQYDAYFVLETIQNEIANSATQLNYLASKLPSIHLIRTEEMTNYQTSIIELIAPYITVHSYQNTVTQNKSNALISLWGKYEKHLTFEHLVNDLIESKANTTALQSLQSSIISPTQTHSSLDNTIQIHGHFTAFREVEGLLNTLISTYSTSSLKAREITVYCNDLKNYIPAIHHFFTHPTYAIPYRIIGEHTYTTDTSIQAVQALMKYNVGNMDPQEMLAILSYSCIQEKFRLDNIEYYHSWINEANILFQYDGNKEQELQFISWKNGLDKLLLGSCTGVEDWYNEDVLMLDVAEGNMMNQLIHFRYFVENTYLFHLDTHTDKTIAHWIQYTTQFLEFFFDVENDEDLQSFKTSLSSFDTGSLALYTYDTWLVMLSALFVPTQTTIASNMGGITFLELKNTQILPASFTALLGLNSSNYPTHAKALAFDLVKDTEEYKNMNAKERDKYNFLQAILQTDEYLYASYLSHDPKNNIVLPPSIIIEQLIDYLEQITQQKLSIVQHPLHSFSNLYNQDNTLTSYTLQQNELVDFKTLFTCVPQENTPQEITISVSKLVNFFADSFSYFYKHNLGIYLNDKQDALPNCEKLQLDPLDNWQIRNYLINNEIDWPNTPSTEQEKVLKILKAKGLLPLNKLGNIALEDVYEKYSELLTCYFDHTKAKNKTTKTVRKSVQIANTTYHIESTVSLVDNEYICPILNSKTSKYSLEWLLTSYILFYNNTCDKSEVYYYKRDKGIPFFTKKQVDKTTINEYLNEASFENLITLFHKGQSQLVPSYFLSNLVAYTNSVFLLEAIQNEKYKSEYLTLELYKPYFINDEAFKEQFLENYQTLYNLISKL